MMRTDRSHSVDRIVSHNGEGLRRLAVVLKGVDGHRLHASPPPRFHRMGCQLEDVSHWAQR
jgi:hypothetical protein